MFNKTICLLSASLMLAACNSTAQPNANAANASASVKQVWHLTELSGYKGAIPAEAKMDWTNLQQAHAYMGCNHINFEAQTDAKGSLKTGVAISTLMYCEGAMPLENAFSKAIEHLTHYELNGKTLILRGKNGVQMKFEPAQ